MADNNGNSKGNGAAKRMANPARKSRRQASWARARKRHEANRTAQEQRHQDNVELLRSIAEVRLPSARPSVQARYARRHGMLREVP